MFIDTSLTLFLFSLVILGLYFNRGHSCLENYDIAVLRILMALSLSVASQELASQFDCPVCFGYILPPIRQCKNGHTVCIHL